MAVCHWQVYGNRFKNENGTILKICTSKNRGIAKEKSMSVVNAVAQVLKTYKNKLDSDYQMLDALVKECEESCTEIGDVLSERLAANHNASEMLALICDDLEFIFQEAYPLDPKAMSFRKQVEGTN